MERLGRLMRKQQGQMVELERWWIDDEIPMMLHSLQSGALQKGQINNK